MMEITYVAIEDLDFSFSDKNRLDHIHIVLLYEQDGINKVFELDINSPQKISQFVDCLPREAFIIEDFEVIQPMEGIKKVTRHLTLFEFMSVYHTINHHSDASIHEMELVNQISAHKYLYDYLVTPLIEAYPDNSRLEEL